MSDTPEPALSVGGLYAAQAQSDMQSLKCGLCELLDTRTAPWHSPPLMRHATKDYSDPPALPGPAEGTATSLHAWLFFTEI